MATVIEFSSSPYPGLRPFRYDESDVFFGREKQIDLLITRLAQHRFLAVIGSSGCGKSSLVRAGLLPALNAGFMAQVGSRWLIVELRPGERPMRQLTRALAAANLFGTARPVEEAAAFIEASLARGPLGLAEVMHAAEAMRDRALLVLVDQFEETFRFGQARPTDEAEAFVALLLASSAQREVPVYVIVTMRSDYLGECAAFRGLAEAVSDSQYLTPRLTRDELELAIDGPARVFGGQIDPKLLNQLLNDFGTDADQLPLLQHALACMWDRHARAGDDEPRLSLADRDAIGGVRMALSNHADEILAELTPDQQRVAEIMFRRLCGSANGRRDVRAPTRVAEVAQIAGTSIDEVIAVVHAFARPDRCLLFVSDGTLNGESMLDICHESLIRQWVRLREWSEREAQSAESYRLLEHTARRWRKGDAALWSTPDLEAAIAWEAREKPNAMWARRYGGDFGQAFEFLRASEEKQQADEAAREERRRADEAARVAAERLKMRRYRRTISGLITLIVVGAGALASWLYLYRREYYADYNTIVSHYGVPEGYGRLTDAQTAERPWSIRIFTRGRIGPILRMEAVNRAGQCEPDNPIAQPLGGDTDINNWLIDQKNLQECQWVFVLDPGGQGLVYEKAYNKRNDLIWGLAFPPPTGDHSVEQAYYVGPDGSLKLQKNTRLHSVELDYIVDKHDKARNGLESGEKYLSYAGGLRRPEPGNKNVFGVAKEFNSEGLEIRRTNLSSDGRSPMNDSDGVAIRTFRYDALGNKTEIATFDRSGRPVLTKNGYQRVRNTYDGNGNLISERYFGTEGQPVRLKDGGYHEERTKYDKGEPVEYAYFDIDGSPAYSNESLQHRTVFLFDGNRLVESRVFDIHDHPTTSFGGQQVTRLGYDDQGNLSSMQYFNADGSPAYGLIGVHKMIWQYDAKGKPVIERMFDADGRASRMTSQPFIDVGMVYSESSYGAEYSYDERGDATSIKFLDKTGAELVGNHRYAKIQRVYDERNNLKELDYLDSLGRPVVLKQTGFARQVTAYDARRNPIREEYFDAQGERVLGNNGYATIERSYDDRDRITEIRYFGTDGKPVLKDGWYAVLTRRYDERDNLIEERLFDADRHPVVKQYAAARYKYDARDRQIEEAYFGVDGKLVVTGDAAIVKTDFDASGMTRTMSYFDVHGNRSASKEGCWSVSQTHDARAKLLEQVCLDKDQKPMVSTNGFSTLSHKYDSHGNVVESASRDEHGHLIMRPGDAALIRQSFDQFNNITDQAFFDSEGKPLFTESYGYASMHRKLDGANVIEESYYGADGKLILLPKGFAMARLAYDLRDNRLETTFYGIDGKPLMQPAGYAAEREKYDQNNNVIEESYYGADGNLITRPDGYAIVRKRYDAHNNVIEIATYGPDQKRVMSAWGMSSENIEYDGKDREVADTYFDQNGESLCRDAIYACFCRTELVYDDVGRQVSARYLSLDNEPAIVATFSFDAKGDQTGVAYKGKQGEPLDYREKVLMLQPGSQGAKQLHPGDILLNYAGIRIDTPNALDRLTGEPLGEKRDLQVLRDGKLVTVQVYPGPLGLVVQPTFVRSH